MPQSMLSGFKEQFLPKQANVVCTLMDWAMYHFSAAGLIRGTNRNTPKPLLGIPLSEWTQEMPVWPQDQGQKGQSFRCSFLCLSRVSTRPLDSSLCLSQSLTGPFCGSTPSPSGGKPSPNPHLTLLPILPSSWCKRPNSLSCFSYFHKHSFLSVSTCLGSCARTPE